MHKQVGVGYISVSVRFWPAIRLHIGLAANVDCWCTAVAVLLYMPKQMHILNNENFIMKL